MAVAIPPWLNIDPIAPARIKLAANAQRNSAAAAERAAQLQAQRIEAEQQMQANQIAAQERAAARRQEVLKQTQDQELAMQAEQNQLRRERQAQQAQQFQQQLQLKEKAAEQAAQEASIQMEGSRGLQKDLEAGIPLEKAFPKHASKLLYKHPERIPSAMKALQQPGALGPEAYQSRPILDAQGQPTGIQAIPGKGAARILPGMREQLTPEGHVRAIATQLAIIKGQINQATDKELPALEKKRDALMNQLETMTSPKVPGKLHETADMMDDGEEAPAEAPADEAAAAPADEEEMSTSSMMDDEEEQ